MSYSEGSWTSNGCTDAITVTFTATDECNLTTSTSFTFTISDTTPPAIAGGANGAAECTGSDPAANAAYLAWRNNFGGVTATDICGAATMSYSEGSWTSNGCTDAITVTFTATDECNLTTSTSFTFTISDTTPPAIAGGANGAAECTGSDPAANAAYLAWRNNFGGVTATDICGAATMSYSEGSWTSNGCTDAITVTFTATDECNLTTSTSFTFTISDTTPPAIAGGANGAAECTGSDPAANAAYLAWRNNFGGVTATDICGAATMSYSEGSWTSNGCTDAITVTFTATDECNLTTSTSFTFTISDTTPPAIAGGANGAAECTGSDRAAHAAYLAWRNNFGGVTATDICGAATMSYSEGSWTSNGCTDAITVTFTATDECNLTTSTSFTFTISDTTPPAIAGGANGAAECTGSDPAANAAYLAWRNNFGGVTATDICGAATMSYSEGSWTSNGCTDAITVTFTATDECNLTTSTSFTFTISDTTPPAIAGGANGAAESTGSDPAANAAYLAWRNNFGGVTATDICGAATMSYSEGSWTSNGCTDAITVTFTATDECNLTTSTSFTFTISDTTPPAIAGGANGAAECTGSDPAANAAYLAWRNNFGGVTATDICGAATMSYSEGSWTSNGCTDAITVTFTATDECNLTTSTSFTFTISDTTPPAIAGGANGAAECTGSDPAANAAYLAWRNNFGGVTATDICGAATMSYSEGSWTSNGCTDAITVTFTATDECNLTTSTSFTFTISDTTPPAIAGGANGAAECTGSDPAANAAYLAWRNNFGGVTATDICGAATMSYSEGSWTSNGCTDAITVTFTATDECNLTTSTSFTFTISDTTPPAIAGGANGAAECTGSDPAANAAYLAWRNNFGGVTATDICGAATMSYSEGSWTSNGCTDAITVTFTATDECNLTTSTSFTFTISDTTPPAIAGGANGAG